MNIKADTWYIFEGDDSMTIVLGKPDTPNIRFPNLKDIEYKNRGLFSSFKGFEAIPAKCFGSPKKLYVGDKLVSRKKCIRIKMGFQNRLPFIPDLPPFLVSQIDTLTNERDYYKKLYLDERDKNLTVGNKDRLREELIKQAESLATLKSKLFSGENLGYSSYYPSSSYRGFGSLGHVQTTDGGSSD